MTLALYACVCVRVCACISPVTSCETLPTTTIPSPIPSCTMVCVCGGGGGGEKGHR